MKHIFQEAKIMGGFWVKATIRYTPYLRKKNQYFLIYISCVNVKLELKIVMDFRLSMRV